MKDAIKFTGAAIVVLMALAIIGTAGSYLFTAGSVATAPARVASRTLETDNIINNYEWFHDANAQYRSRVAQIADHKKFLKDENDKAERQRLRMEMAAMQQSCRDLATRYNANATKTNRSIFMGREAPDSLNLNNCE